MKNKAESLVDLLNKAYKPLRFDMYRMEFYNGYRFRVYDQQSGEFYSFELCCSQVEADDKLLEKLLPPIEAFHKRHHSKLAKLLRGEG